MNREENIVDGILHHRSGGKRPWAPYTLEQLTNRVVELRGEIDRLKIKPKPDTPNGQD